MNHEVFVIPCSFAQQRLWFLDQLQPGDPAYNIPVALHIAGALNASVLENCLNEVIVRHESLRTTFTSEDGQPQQVIYPELSLKLPVIDVSPDPSSVTAFIAEEAARSFDLAKGPLLRTTLLRLQDDEWVWLINMHHIISDGWSIAVFINEIASLYDAFTNGRPSPLPPLPIQYADYALWQSDRLQGEFVEEKLAYWKQQLAGNHSLVELPTDKSRQAVKTSRGTKHFLEYSRELTDKLKLLSRQEGATLFMVLLAAFKTLLFRYSKQSDITVGSSIAGRNWAETEGLIGFFLNTLVLRSDLSGGPGFREVLSRVRKVTLDAYSNQDIPVEMLLEVLQPERQLDRNPLFQVMFILQNTPVPKLEFAGLKLRPLEFHSDTAKFDLSLDLTEGPEGLKGWLEYSTDLFEAATIERMAAHFEALLEAIVAQPDVPISKLPLLNTQEKTRLLIEWNQTQRPYTRAQCIHDMFEAQAERHPDQIALIHEQQQLSYAELNARANQLAHHLRRAGVGPEVLVGIMVERSLEMVVALLGVLKAGAAYVPMDPRYPADRLRYMMQDARVAIVLTQDRLTRLLSEPSVPLLCLDSQWDTVDQESRDNPAPIAVAENLAYLIYTSGSTGRPKGVMVQHSSLVNYVHAASQAYQLQHEDRVLQFASLSFDTSAEEIFPCLTCGATLVLRTEAMMATVKTFLEHCEDLGITVLNLPTAYWHEMTRPGTEDLAVPVSMRQVIIGGEKALPERLELWHRQVNSDVALVNTYGPTEGTIVATMHFLNGKDAMTADTVAIGRPVANVQTYVLDEHFEPVPVGIVGELYIGGAGVSRGYLNSPELTAARFIPDPFASEPGQRLYVTGDLARYSPAGILEYRSRGDDQVKIRGFRVELGELETVLRQHPGVSDVVVIASEHVPGEKQLVCYVVLKPELPATVAQLRLFAKERLPDYMLPAWFVVLPALPLTPSGKIDKQSLPAPERDRSNVETISSEPRNQVEEVVAEIWADVLGLDRVGTEDNFFEVGGHSLLATQVISRLRQTFRVEVSLLSFFETPTVVGLSKTIEAAMRGSEQLQKPPLTPVSRDLELPLSFAQERLWFLNQLDPASAAYHVLRPLRIHGPLNIELMERTLTEVMRRHEVYRTVFPAPNGRAVQNILPLQPVHLPVVDLRRLPETEREAEAQRRIHAEGLKCFDLAEGPLWRLLLMRLQDDEYILMLTEHHMVHDGWTEGALVRDFLALYVAFAAGNPSPLDELPIQYADFAYWQRQWLQGETLDILLSYWKEHLRGAPPLLALPTDRSRPAVQTFRGALSTFTFSEELTKKINDLNRREGVTLFMTLLAAFKTLLHRYSRQDEIVVGTSIANRNWIEIEKLTGFFVNTLPLRTSFAGDPSFRELLRRVRDVSLAGYAHQDLPFEKLVEELQPGRDLNHQAVFQVMFILQNAPLTSLELPDLNVELLQVHNGTSKFDLLLSMIEREGELHGALEYSTDLFDEATIERMLRHFETLMEGLVTNLQLPVSELPLLTAAERQQMVVDWNATAATVSSDTGVHKLFESQVTRVPNKVAAVFANESVTYHELNRRANQLAWHLIHLGIGPGAVVGICLERSIEMIVALLGILKTGAAYLPLDPAHPRQRTSDILEDSQVSLLLTEKRLAHGIVVPDLEMLYLDTGADEISRQSTSNPSGARAQNLSGVVLAYVIYTSGSTGKPKGVLVPHGAVINFLRSMAEQPGMTESDRLFAVTTLSFDIAALELFLPLTVGATIVIADRETLADGLMLREQLAQHRPTVMQATPATWRLLIDAGWRGSSELRILCGGEALPRELARELLKRGVQLWNLYGPTETTIWSSIDEVDAREAKVTLGRPIANTQIYLLDSKLQLVPVGVPGELYIAGNGLAHGYHNRPDLTAERFIPDPFSQTPGARMYRTGDLARYLRDGRIEYVERIDHQVKIRGFRIELGEIESALKQHEEVGDTVVIARADSRGEKSLVAYVVRDEQAKAAQHAVAERQWSDEQVAHWQMAWEQNYVQTPAVADPTFNIAGWNSSYTGLPIPEAEMREWTEGTVERILALRPKRVLEIGCGTGLLLFRIAPECTHYVGTDISPHALRSIQSQLPRLQLGHVQLLQRTADDLFELESQQFDTVILNSVIQYFPGIEYLLRVLERAQQLLSPGGQIFIGDVRSFALLEAFHTSVQSYKAAASLPISQLRQKIETQMSREEELTVHPDFFHALKNHFPDVSAVEVQLRRGRFHNELTRFRYDVVLRIGKDKTSKRDLQWMDWQEHHFTARDVEQLLTSERPEVLGVTAIPNARLTSEARLHDLLANQNGLQIAGDLRHVSSESDDGKRVDPESLWELGDQLNYTVAISWSNRADCYDVLFKRCDMPNEIPVMAPSVKSEQDSWRHYANDPLKAKLVQALARRLRDACRQRLPDYMVPSAFVVLESLPRTPNGKLDRKALPEPDRLGIESRAAYVAPRTETEETLARIWSEVLGVERVGVRDTFFDLGGHSLLATQVLMRLREAFQVEIPLRKLFETPTVEGLAIAVIESEAEGADAGEVVQILAQLGAPI